MIMIVKMNLINMNTFNNNKNISFKNKFKKKNNNNNNSLNNKINNPKLLSNNKKHYKDQLKLKNFNKLFKKIIKKLKELFP